MRKKGVEKLNFESVGLDVSEGPVSGRRFDGATDSGFLVRFSAWDNKTEVCAAIRKLQNEARKRIPYDRKAAEQYLRAKLTRETAILKKKLRDEPEDNAPKASIISELEAALANLKDTDSTPIVEPPPPKAPRRLTQQELREIRKQNPLPTKPKRISFAKQLNARRGKKISKAKEGKQHERRRRVLPKAVFDFIHKTWSEEIPFGDYTKDNKPNVLKEIYETEKLNHPRWPTYAALTLVRYASCANYAAYQILKKHKK
jgi:hypothetical protein